MIVRNFCKCFCDKYLNIFLIEKSLKLRLYNRGNVQNKYDGYNLNIQM